MVNVKSVYQFRKLHEVEEENGKIYDRLESFKTSCDTSKQHINKLSESISKLEADKAEKAAKLICLESENQSLKQEVSNLKVINFYIRLNKISTTIISHLFVQYAELKSLKKNILRSLNIICKKFLINKNIQPIWKNCLMYL